MNVITNLTTAGVHCPLHTTTNGLISILVSIVAYQNICLAVYQHFLTDNFEIDGRISCESAGESVNYIILLYFLFLKAVCYIDATLSLTMTGGFMMRSGLLIYLSIHCGLIIISMLSVSLSVYDP